jgi:capsid protein
VFDALTKCEWIGASRGQIDELKETEAALARVEGGISTREDELARLGKDWRKVFRQMAREKKLADELGITFVSMANRQATGIAADNSQGGDQQDQKAA